MLCDSETGLFVCGVDTHAASWVNFVMYSTASSISCFSFSLIFKFIFPLIYSWNCSQLVFLLQSLGGGFFRITWVLTVIMMALWSDSRSRLGSIRLCKSDIPLVIAKSSRSGILFMSVGQYVGSPVDR